MKKPPPKALGYFNDVMPPSLSNNHVYTPPTQEAMVMAKKKAAKKKAAKKAAPKKTAKVGKGVETNPTAPLPTMEDIDERIEPIDVILDKIVANDARRRALKADNDKLTQKLGPLMAEHKVDSYKTPAASVYVQHGEDVIVIKPTKKK